MKKLLLINPWIYDFTAYDLWSKPLGLLYLASFLRSFDYSTALIDCLDKHCSGTAGGTKVKKYGTGKFQRTVVEKPEVLNHIPRHFARYGISEQQFIRQLNENSSSDAVLITSIMTYWYPGVKHCVDLVRKYLPGVPVILGGIYATLLPQHAEKTIQPDYLINGPGEIKALELLSALFNQEFDKNRLPQKLDDYPFPAFDLINHPDYMALLTTRGCPYDCSFCAQKNISMSYCRRSPENVIAEIEEHHKRYKVLDFAFYDDALFIAKEKHIEKIFEEIIRRRLDVRFHSPNGLFAGYIDSNLARLMFESNLKTVRLSFETSNEQRRLDMYSKVSNEEMVSAVEDLVKAGYRAKNLEAYVMMGLPAQSVDEVLASALFVHNLGIQIRLASFSPIQGTAEFDKAVRQNLIAEDIDPLLTNKSIFPLHNEDFSYEKFRKIRTFCQVLNDAVKRELPLFTDPVLGDSIQRAVKDIL